MSIFRGRFRACGKILFPRHPVLGWDTMSFHSFLVRKLFPRVGIELRQILRIVEHRASVGCPRYIPELIAV